MKKIFQITIWAVLDLVEDEEGVFCVDGLAHRKGDVLKHAPRIMGALE